MSRTRLHAKLRQNDEYPAIKKFLGQIGFTHTLHTATGSGHPFILINLPHGGEPLRHLINCTPRGGGNPKAEISRLRRALRAAGYDFGA